MTSTLTFDEITKRVQSNLNDFIVHDVPSRSSLLIIPNNENTEQSDMEIDFLRCLPDGEWQFSQNEYFTKPHGKLWKSKRFGTIKIHGHGDKLNYK